MWEAPRTDHAVCVPMNCTNINYMSIVAQYIVIVNYVKTIYRFRNRRRILSTYKIGRQYDFSAKCRKKRPQICDRFGYAAVIFALSQSRCCPIQDLFRICDCLFCVALLDSQFVRIPCHGTKRCQGVCSIADCIWNGDIVVDLMIIISDNGCGCVSFKDCFGL